MVFKCILLAATALVLSTSLNAALTNLQALEDATTSGWEPDTNFNNEILSTSEDWPNPIHISYIKFDLSSIPSNEVIVGATLNLFQVAAIGPGVAFGNSLYNFTDNWSESTITANNALNDVTTALSGPVLSVNTDVVNIKYTQWDLFQYLAWDHSADRADGLLSLLIILKKSVNPTELIKQA